MLVVRWASMGHLLRKNSEMKEDLTKGSTT